MKLLEIEGTVFSGKGRGSFFVSLDEYEKQFELILGEKPYFGTLNLKVDPTEAKRFLEEEDIVLVEGFENDGKIFGKVLCYKVEIAASTSSPRNDNLTGIIVTPEKTFYKGDTFEIISECFLRETLGLKDGDKVIIKA